MREKGVEEEMKKIGDVYSCRGQIPVNTPNVRIYLFDGRFDTGWRIESLTIVNSTPLTGPEFQLILSTEELTDSVTVDWNEQPQIGLATWNAPATGATPTSWVDPDNLIIEDLFLSSRGSEDDTYLNYMITMQKYKVSDWKGALAMVRNRSQA